MLPKIRFVVATREKKEDFHHRTATGRTLAAYRFPFIELELATENRDGLPAVYNRAIERAAEDPAILVFIHDDVHICGYYWIDEVLNALAQFQVAGIAGNKRRLPQQPAWAFTDTNFTWDAPDNLSGIVGHGKGFPPDEIVIFGGPCQEVKLLDGLMLVCHSKTLIESGIRFDERFAFHFYDMDFCRQTEAVGLKMGTCALSVVHESAGHFGSPAWHDAYRKYLDKWRD